ncbi:quinone oxidoreductase family protein [Lentilactobacillus kosonis]|uniref:Alcohol dehydrogenase, zinc-binding domain protein n=1 Tax=Lentilactobacillus kosonis TaxID=2810561 RepID=A0A401FL33_9LACO|nr:zinc-binding alcohol dehydrogenase family protein [Lentilactobacillus kosonis]GAY72978.1 alcohol dehydrogenase, zinc-binding domain protein [Lentilactobacillus kosonis]
MKAAVLNEYGKVPVYQDIDDPIVKDSNQMIVTPVASSIKRLDIGKAAGKHYTNFDPLPAVMGMDGVAKTDDGKLVFAMGLSGMMAEKALVNKNQLVPVPNQLDPALAAAMPNVLMGSDIALTIRGKIKAGDVVLVNGATGSTGMMAVQMAKYRGASKVIATGRSESKLAELKSLGADDVVLLTDSDKDIERQIKELYKDNPISVIVDYLWGHPAEIIFNALSRIKLVKPLVYVTIGQMAGAEVTLTSQLFRSRDLTLVGSGIGSFDNQEFITYLQSELPKLYDYAAAGNLQLNVNKFALADISEAWEATGRPVIMI